MPCRDHGHNTPSGNNPPVNPDRATSDARFTCTGDNRTPVLGAYTHMVIYFTDFAVCNSGVESGKFAITGNNARTGGCVATNFGAITGDNAAAVLGVAAIKDALDNAAAGGNLVRTTKKPQLAPCNRHVKPRQTRHPFLITFMPKQGAFRKAVDIMKVNDD